MTHPEGWRKGCFWRLFSCRGQESGGLRHAIEKVPDKPRLFHWWRFTPKSEPISEKISKAQPRRLRAHTTARPTRKTLCLFFISPRRISFLVERVGFSGSPPTASSGDVGALVGTADTLRAKQRHGLITSCVYHRNHLLQAYLRNSVL